MAGEWREQRWGDLATLEYGRALRGHGQNGGRFRVFGTNGPIGWHDEALCPHAGVIIGRKGAYRGVHYSPAPFFVIDTAFYLSPKTQIDLRWAYYELLAQDINSLDSGSAIPSTSRESFYSLSVRVPPLPEQRAIAHILGTLDDKIELNRRMSETLEAMARALFKSWFVDFLPVRAKMAAKERDPSLLLPQAEPNTWYVYAIECNDGSLYIGQTEDLRQRWLQHVGGKGASWTKQHPPVQVPYWEKQPSREAAVERENWLKTGYGRKWLKHEIAARTQTGDPVRAKAEGRLPAGRQATPAWPKPGAWCAYALECDDSSIYIGHTDNLERRFEEHRKGKGADWTKRHPPKRVAFWERCESRTAAVEREKKLKTGSGREWLKLEIARRDIADGLPQPLADLFPDSFEDSELGEIPRGWEVKRLPELIEVNPPRALRKGEVAPYLDMANMPTRGHSPDSVIERSFGSGMRFVNGDTLVARITPCLENGKTAFVDFLAPGQIGWGSTEYIVLRSKPPLPAEFAYCLARSDGFRDFAIQSMTGSSGRQRVPAESLDHYLLTSCPEPIAHAFGSIVASMFARASKASAESRTLAALRDALLPKLISGELRVKDAEGFLKERAL